MTVSGGTPPYNYDWIDSDGNTVSSDANATGLLAGDYTYTITDANNCEYDSTLSIWFDGGYDCIEVPIIISPNFDGTNDTWDPVQDLDTDIEVTILNRWGEVEFYYSGNSTAFSWDGKMTDGRELPSFDYYFIIKFNNINYPDKTGVITLIR